MSLIMDSDNTFDTFQTIIHHFCPPPSPLTDTLIKINSILWTYGAFPNFTVIEFIILLYKEML